MTESIFSSTVLIPGLRKHEVVVDRIENTAGSGISDISAIWNKQEIWIETKIVHGRRVSFRTLQGSWITRRTMAGSRVFTVARKDDEIYTWWAVDLLLLPRTVAPDNKSFTVEALSRPPLVTLRKKPGFDWEKLRHVLFTFYPKSDFSDVD